MAIAGGLVPIVVLAGLGFLLSRRFPIDARSLTRIVWYLLSPALYFSWLSQAKSTPAQMAQLALISALVATALLVVARLAVQWLPYDPVKKHAITVTTGFMNCANFGLPVVLFVLGPQAAQSAVIFAATQSILFNSVGVGLAAGAGRGGLRQAVARSVGQPSFWAVAAAVVCKVYAVRLPELLIRSVDLLAQAAIPLMIVLLGIQLSRVDRLKDYPLIALTSFLRLVVGPGVAFLLVRYWPGISLLNARVIILESAMPSAVNNILLAGEFNTEPELVSGIIFSTTVLSFFSLSGLVSLWH